MSLGYMWEQLYLATELLASGTGSIQDRIHNIYVSHQLPSLELEMEKEDLHDLVNKLERKLENSGLLTFTELIEKVRESNLGQNLSVEVAVKIAKTIISMYDTICRLYPIEFDNI